MIIHAKFSKLYINYFEIVIFLVFLSLRLYFATSQPIFFDSFEYLERLSDPNFLHALFSGHPPLHSGYIFILWPIYQFAKLFLSNPTDLVISFQILVSGISMLALYNLITKLWNKKIASISLLIILLLPLLWISQMTLMMEGLYVALFIISLNAFNNYLSDKSYCSLVVSLCCWVLSLAVHIGVLLWIPLFLYLLLYHKAKSKLTIITLFSFTTVLVFLIMGYLTGLRLGISPLSGLRFFLFTKTGEHANFGLQFNSILIFIRNIIVPIFYNNTVLISLLALISLFNRKHKHLLLLWLWILPTILVNQWWDSLFFGRHALIVILAMAILVALLIKNKTHLVLGILIYLVIATIPSLAKLRNDSPYINFAQKSAQIPLPNLLICDHFSYPLMQRYYKGEIISVNEPGWSKNGLVSEINKKINSNIPVYILSTALSEPYGLYNGPFLHSLSLSYKKDFDLKKDLQGYQFVPYLEINKKDNLVIYQITKGEKSGFPEIVKLSRSTRRLDYYDPLMQIWYKILAYNDKVKLIGQ